MTSLGRKSIKHIGTLHGEGILLTGDGGQLGPVTYEIDGYIDRGAKFANGQLEAETGILDQACQTSDATLVLDSGRCIHVVVSGHRAGAAEVRVTGTFPL